MLPIIIERKLERGNARNWPGVVVIDPDCPLRYAVEAQECYEAMWKLNPLNLLRVVFSKKHRRAMEIRGHEIEVQAAVRLYRQDETAYRAKEAADLTAYREFKGIPRWKIKAAMEAQRSFAARWVADNAKRIGKRV